MDDFKEDLKEALKEGILIAVKWGFLAFLILFSYYYITDTRRMATNGEQAAMAIKVFQEKGWLPIFDKFGNLPEKEDKDKSK